MRTATYLASYGVLICFLLQAKADELLIVAPQLAKHEFYNDTSSVLFTSGASEVAQPERTSKPSSGDDVGGNPTVTVTVTKIPDENIPEPTAPIVSDVSPPTTSAVSDLPTSVAEPAPFPQPVQSLTGGSSSTSIANATQGTPFIAPSSTTMVNFGPGTTATESKVDGPMSSDTGKLAPSVSTSGTSNAHAPMSSGEISVPGAANSTATATGDQLTNIATATAPTAGPEISAPMTSTSATNLSSIVTEPAFSGPGTSVPLSTGIKTSESATQTSAIETVPGTALPVTESSSMSQPTIAPSTTILNATLPQSTDPANLKTTTLDEIPVNSTTMVVLPSETTSVAQAPSNNTSTILPSETEPAVSSSSIAEPNLQNATQSLSSTGTGYITSTAYPHITSSTSSTAYNETAPATSYTDPTVVPTESSTISSTNAPYTSTSIPIASNQTTQTIGETGAPTRSPTVVPITTNGTVTYTSVTPTSIPSQLPITSFPNATTTLSSGSSGTTILSSTITTQRPGTSTTAPTVVLPTATNSHSTFIPSSIIAQTSATHTSDETMTTTQTGIPSALPKIVQNPLSSSTPVQPVDTTEVQIGFQWALNYPFVVSHPLSTSQIFTYLPIGVADGLGLKSDQIVVKNLLPLDTTAELNFITTVARIFIPTSMVDTLRVDLGIPVSPIYQNQDESVNTLMNYINPAIPFFPGAIMDPESYPSPTDNHVKPTISDVNGVFNSGGQQAQSPSAKGTTAGIALAAFGGAAAYGAAMFLLARRYKRRKQQRGRTASISNSSDSRDFSSPISPDFGDSGALMSGGRSSPTHDRHSRGSGKTGNTGFTARTAQISAPMMSENSLGWT